MSWGHVGAIGSRNRRGFGARSALRTNVDQDGHSGSYNNVI
jgi:hypothetical protein